MSFLDTTLTPASGYSYVHCGQVYDAIAARLGAHSAWEYVEYVDYVASGNTNRTHVWKCKSAVSGLTADFFVLFTVRFVTATGVYATTPTTEALWISLCELYNTSTKVASKYVPEGNQSSSVTINADGSHPGTWALNTTRPTSNPNNVARQYIGPLTSSTSFRLIIAVTNDVLFMATNTGPWLYAGAMETILGPTLDPLPLVLATAGPAATWSSYSTFATSSNTGSLVASTRHPGMSGANTYRFGFCFYSYYYGGSISPDTRIGNLLSVITAQQYTSQYGGVLGDTTDTGWSLWNNGVIAAKICVSSCGLGTGATKGGHRGYLKNMLTCTLAAHAFGDTFQVSGKSYVGFGGTGLGIWDTTA